ncbi:hypothetical protein KIL84_017869 [Mauremys mutica]|uniref:Uncharacterized protein n=1 Tax=Mauremys mutica TaxID=74926 RepID=A0A9D4AZ15_9SAUR|nr:hypothetical protein KIL84_017869 [Mauremys mutica]
MPVDLKVVLHQAVKMFNFIKAQALNSHLFCALKQEVNTNTFSIQNCYRMGNDKDTAVYSTRKGNEKLPIIPKLGKFSILKIHSDLIADMKEQCLNLITKFNEYFPDSVTNENWIRDPFSIEDTLPDCFLAKLTELSSDGGSSLNSVTFS